MIFPPRHSQQRGGFMPDSRLQDLAVKIIRGEKLSDEEEALTVGNHLEMMEIFSVGRGFVFDRTVHAMERDQARAAANGDLVASV